MVGPPKTIEDLARLDANPVVSCRRCIWRVEYDRARLSHLRMMAGLNNDWRMFCEETRCEDCGSRVRVTIKPFVSDTALRDGDTKMALVFKALCVLEEAMVVSRSGRAPTSYGLRFALAYLYAVGDRRGEGFDRGPYVEFWQLATRIGPTGDDTQGVGRRTTMRSCLNAIARAAGMELTPEINAKITKAVLSE